MHAFQKKKKKTEVLTNKKDIYTQYILFLLFTAYK